MPSQFLSKRWLTLLKPPLFLLLSMMLYDVEYLFSWFGSPAWLSPPSLLHTPRSAHWWGRVRTRPQCCTNAVEQKLQHYCVISTGLVKNLNSSTVWAAMKKMILARPHPLEFWKSPVMVVPFWAGGARAYLLPLCNSPFLICDWSFLCCNMWLLLLALSWLSWGGVGVMSSL